jgi:hypothetical protein
MCVDAMENVPPEQWPIVLTSLRRAVHDGGYLYLTVELTDDDALAAVAGEDARRGGGYHFYPRLDQVRDWLADAGVGIVDEAHSPGGHPSYSYQHFLGQSRP